MASHRIYTTSFASVYPHYVAKAEKKGRAKADVDEVIRWLTGYSQDELENVLTSKTDLETFFAKAPQMNPARTMAKGVSAVFGWRRSKSRPCGRSATWTS